jgi:hypothetical protein
MTPAEGEVPFIPSILSFARSLERRTRRLVLEHGRAVVEGVLAAQLCVVDESREHVSDLGAALAAKRKLRRGRMAIFSVCSQILPRRRE